jgi:hypothetical protein
MAVDDVEPAHGMTKCESTSKCRRGLRALAAAAGLAVSSTVFAIPASAGPAVKEFDIWNLTSTEIKISGYESSPSGFYKVVPKDKLPKDTVIPIGRNLHIAIEEGYGATAVLLGRAQTPQGGAQIWKVTTNVEKGNEFLPAPIVHMFCAPEDGKNAACGVSVGPNVSSLADAPGTTVTVPAADTQTQGELKNSLCGNPYTGPLHIKCNDSAQALTVSAGNTVWTLLHT